MGGKARGASRREDSLSRDRIVDASIEILDQSGEAGLTFRALSERLATGPGAIYWHIANKSDLLIAACDAMVVQTLNVPLSEKTPEAAIRAIALALFDAIDEHPWLGSGLTNALGRLPIVRIGEQLGQQIVALGVPEEKQRITVFALLSYIVGVSIQNAANTQLAKELKLDRATFLNGMAEDWSKLDSRAYPFTRSISGQLPGHDDRQDFLEGIDLILQGIDSQHS